MKRLIAVTVAVIMSLTLISPSMQAAEWDTSKPPVSVIRQIVPERPSGDDHPWIDQYKSLNWPSYRVPVWVQGLLRSLQITVYRIDVQEPTQNSIESSLDTSSSGAD